MAKVFSLHFEEQIRLYQRQIVINLLDRRGAEQELAQAYEEYLKQVNPNDVKYLSFDFHQHCKNDNFEQVCLLLELVGEDLRNIGYFLQRRSSISEVAMTQAGTIRTNCLDCLDRTNLVQSKLAHRVLLHQLQQLGADKESLNENPLIDKLFKEAWANNGDALSQQYAGTSALKGDFTRTGKRRMKGKLNDGVNSLSRYVINNFYDRLRQIAVDLLLGNMDINSEEAESELSHEDCLWAEEQIRGIQACSEAILAKGEEVVNGWIAISINKRRQEQERVIIIGRQAFYRCKFNYREDKLVHYKSVPLNSIVGIYKGHYRPGTYGMCLVTNNPKKPHHYFKPLVPPHFPPEIGKELILGMVDTFLEVLNQMASEERLQPDKDIFVEEIELTYPSCGSSIGVAVAYNAMGLGIYKKKGNSNRGKSKKRTNSKRDIPK
jgi:hypothetical protein